jgi:uncharacterized membrane protein AbrB (regulator of aidB expression)
VKVIRILAVIAIIAGVILNMQGWPEGYTIIKCGIAVLVLSIVLGLFRIPRYSRGRYPDMN